MRTLKFEGEVITGEGNGKKYLSFPWVQQQIEEKLGFTPFPGTLNLRLNKNSSSKKEILEKNETTRICPAVGYCVGILFKAKINNIECAIVIPKIANYPKTTLEIIAPQNLREALNLKDGDKVAVSAQI